jgi:hypothetical protein
MGCFAALCVCEPVVCASQRVGRGGGETVHPRHIAHCWGAVGSVESVTACAGAAVQGQKMASIEHCGKNPVLSGGFLNVVTLHTCDHHLPAALHVVYTAS